MSTSERWAAIGAIGAMLAGISEIGQLIIPAIQTMWGQLPESGEDFWTILQFAGLVVGAVGALVAIGLMLRARSKSDAAGVEAIDRRRNLLLILTTLALIATVGITFVLAGGLGSVKKTVEEASEVVATGKLPRDTSEDSLERVCTDARKKYRSRARRSALTEPAGIWTGWTTWRGGEQQWRFDPDGSVQLTGGLRGSWTRESGGIIIRFTHKTQFHARIYGEMMCGIRLKPDGDDTPDGNFSMVFDTSLQVEAATDNTSIDL